MDEYKHCTVREFMGGKLIMTEAVLNDDHFMLFTLQHRASDITIRWNNRAEHFKFQYNPQYYKHAKFEDVIDSLLLDASAYEDYKDDKAGFLREFGYIEDDEDFDSTSGRRRTGDIAYNGCRTNYKKLHRLFSEDELFELQRVFSENY